MTSVMAGLCSLPAHLLPGDLLHGSRAIAAHLGVRRSLAVHLIRAGLIPWFSLGGVACARRSTLAAHFAELEASVRDRGGLTENA